MRKTLLTMILVGLVPIITAGCVSKSEYLKSVQRGDQREQDLHALEARYSALEAINGRVTADRDELQRTLTAKTDELTKINLDLRQRLSALESDNARLTHDLAETQQARDEAQRARDEAQQAREEKVREVSSTYEQLVEKMKGEIAKGEVTISELKGKLTVNMVEAILFDSGKAEIKPQGLVVLGKVIEILKNVNDKSIRIEGHTDNVPIAGALAHRYATNWELSAARAINVTRYLQTQAIDPANLSAAAFGEFKPVADNATPEGRAKNRRIEIVLVPKD